MAGDHKPSSSGSLSRASLAARLEQFPPLLRQEQRRALLALVLFTLFLLTLVFLAGYFVMVKISPPLLLWITSWPPLASLYSAGKIAVFLLLCWLTVTKVFPWMSLALSSLAGVTSYRRSPFDPAEIPRVAALLRSDAPFGLYLRGFGDESGPLRAPRDEIAHALGKEAIPMLAVSNPRGIFPPSGLIPLCIPTKEWQETVIELMRQSVVVVVDLNAGVHHWLADVPTEIGGVALEAAVGRWGGLVLELETLLTEGFDKKVVALVPPGWAQMVGSKRVAVQIVTEVAIAMKRHQRILKVRRVEPTPEAFAGMELLASTRLKSALLRLPRTTSDIEEVCKQVQELAMSSVEER